MRFIAEKIDIGSLELKDQVVSINRVTKVVKGGKNLSFSALVVVGDSAGHVGYGMGKAREVSSAIKKGVEAAKKNVVRVSMTEKGFTIPHTVTGRFGSGMVLLKPASEGTGVIAGGAVRAVITAAGIQNILTKSLGSTTAHNVVKATIDALMRLKQPQRVARLRGRGVEDIMDLPSKEKKAPAAAPAPAEGWGARTIMAKAGGKAAKATGTVKIKQVGSLIGCTDGQRACVRGLGLRKLQQVVERQDTPMVRGMINKVPHLVAVVE